MKFATQGMVRFYVNSFINTSIHLVCICHHIQYLLSAGDGDAAVVGGLCSFDGYIIVESEAGVRLNSNVAGRIRGM